MFQVLLRASSFGLIIVIGFLLNHYHIVDETAGASMKKILINITLPCAIIVNFSKIDSAGILMAAIALSGLLCNVLMLGIAVVLTKRREKKDQVFYMISMPSYNIGAFVLPFVQTFLPGLGVVAACMFDVGNSIMCTGGTYSFTAEYTARGEKKERLDITGICKRLLTSPPLMSYVIMFLLTLVKIRIPETFLTLISPLAGANTFVAMMMIGLLFHLELKKSYLAEIFRVLAFRHLFAIVLSCLIYFVLPLDIVIRQALVLVCFAPVSAVAPAYTGICGGDEGKASALNSLSIICSMIGITILLLLMGLS